MGIAKKTNKKGIYLDYASTTPVDPAVVRAMAPLWSRDYGNPSALHGMGIAAKQAVAESRAAIAEVLFARPDEIIFTSGGTESDNLAIFGTIAVAKKYLKHPHIVTTNIEHSAVLKSCKYLEEQGIEVTYVPIGASGIVDPAEIKKALRETTVLVSVMYANNEIGTIQPITEIAKIIRHHKKHAKHSYGTELFTYPALHTDATQAMNYLPVNIAKLGVDMLSFNGSKIYGPKGAGVLYKRAALALAPMMLGGEQERGLRAGTENVPLIAGLARALAIAEKMKTKESARLTLLRDYFFKIIAKHFSSALANGDRTNRLPNNVNVSFPGYESDFLVIELDARGIFVSGKSACTSGDGEVSHVIAAIRPDADETEGSVRFSLGRSTTKRDIDRTVSALSDIFEKQKKWHK